MSRRAVHSRAGIGTVECFWIPSQLMSVALSVCIPVDDLMAVLAARLCLAPLEAALEDAVASRCNLRCTHSKWSKTHKRHRKTTNSWCFLFSVLGAWHGLRGKPANLGARDILDINLESSRTSFSQAMFGYACYVYTPWLR